MRAVAERLVRRLAASAEPGLVSVESDLPTALGHDLEASFDVVRTIILRLDDDFVHIVLRGSFHARAHVIRSYAFARLQAHAPLAFYFPFTLAYEEKTRSSSLCLSLHGRSSARNLTNSF